MFKKYKDETKEKPLDLTKILDGCPVGTKFYSVIYGDVEFENIIQLKYYPVVFRSANDPNATISITSKGLHNCNFNGECTLFPSKDQRDWSKFERFWDKPKKERFDPATLKPFDRVLSPCLNDGRCRWVCRYFSHFEENKHYFTNGTCSEYCIPYNDETKHLVGTSDEAPEYYRYWEDQS